MTILILTILASCIILAIQAKRTATAIEADNALLRTHLSRTAQYQNSIDMRLVEAAMDKLEVDDLLREIDREAENGKN